MLESSVQIHISYLRWQIHRTQNSRQQNVKLRSCKPNFENYFYESFIALYLASNTLVANSLKAYLVTEKQITLYPKDIQTGRKQVANEITMQKSKISKIT